MNKYLEHMVKKAGIPGAIGGAITGGFPPLGALYGAVNGLKNVKNPIIGALAGGLTGLIPPVGMVHGVVAGLQAGEKIPEKDKIGFGGVKNTKKHTKKAGLGDIAKGLIKNKIGPDLGRMAANIGAKSRMALGSKSIPNVLSGIEKSKHTSSVLNYLKKKAPSSNYTGNEGNRIMAVADRARRMGRL